MTLWGNLVVVMAVCLIRGPLLAYADGDNDEVLPPAPSGDPCPRPPDLENGVFTLDETRRNAFYRCNHGYTLHGPDGNTLRCQDRQWVGSIAVCSVILETSQSPADGDPCPSPPDLENSVFTLDESRGSGFYRCNPGYTLYGPHGNTLRCQDGRWNGSIPVCSAQGCQGIPVVEPSIIITRQNRGTVREFKCFPGYDRQGPAFIYCDGTRWRNESPRCVFQGSPSSCPEPPRRTNARMMITAGGRGVSYTCAAGYQQRLGSRTIYCNTDGQWIGYPAMCARAGCEVPGKNDVSNGVIAIKQSMVLKITCHPGYDLVGSSALFCDGQSWNGSLPSCQLQQRNSGYPSRIKDGTRCGSIPAVSNSAVEYNTEYDDSGRPFYAAIYTCNPGFFLHPADYAVYCTGGNVAGTPPHCYAHCGHNNGGCRHVCTNTDQGAVCSCRDGYKLGDYGKRCTDIDECASNRGRGACEHRCVNHIGGFQCSCNHGYTLGTDGTSCTEIRNPCNCGTHGRCVEPRGRTPRYCQCYNGYQRSTDGLSCERAPVTQCNCGAGSTSCTEENGVRTCSCMTGYRQSGSGCVDVNECRESGGLADCQKGCTNTVGSYRCYCPGSWQYLSEDSRTCRERPCSCGTGSTGCSQPKGRRICTCAMGYKRSSTGDSCVDRDECRQESSPCAELCVNTEGSYRCSCRTSGYRLAQDGYRCEDIDECQDDRSNQCKHGCVNTPGSYRCECPAGHLLMPDGKSCEECRPNSYRSSTSNECVECPQYSRTNGRAKATIDECHCLPGYSRHPGEEILCKDNDECEGNNGGCEQHCINTPGSFYCACPTGYDLLDNGRDCVDRDECSQSNGGCQHNCINSDGSFKCTCNEGYMVDSADSYLCADVDECSTSTHGCDQKCVNYAGSYHCECDDQSRLARDGRSCYPVTCNPLILPDKMRVSPRELCLGTHPTRQIEVDTSCKVACKKGYELRGPARRTCLKTGQWSAQPASCIPIRCPALQNPKNGLVRPISCLLNNSNEYHGSCVFSCNEGYALEGPTLTSCEGSGNWSREAPICKEVSEITCPKDVTIVLQQGQAQAVVDLPEPVHSLDKIKSSVPAEGHAFDVGTTKVTYTALSNTSDSSTNCSFNVIVNDEEPPVFKICPESFTLKTATQYPSVNWTEPVVTDNVGVVGNTTRISPDRRFTWGTYTVLIDARDGSGNTATCQFSISIQTKECGTPAAPANGKISCSDWMFGKICEPSCHDSHYFFDGPPSSVFLCGFDGAWSPSSVAPDCSPFTTHMPELGCPAGSVQKSFSAYDMPICISCPRGMYFREVNSTVVCLPCQVGTYQDEFGQDSCKLCPSGQTTDTQSSKGNIDCHASEAFPTTMEAPVTSDGMTSNQTSPRNTDVPVVE